MCVAFCLMHGSTNHHLVVLEPSFAERARTLVYLGHIGSISTLSRKQPGFPFGSVMPYSFDENGRPIFLISTLAMHTQNLQLDPRASLLVAQSDASGSRSSRLSRAVDNQGWDAWRPHSIFVGSEGNFAETRKVLDEMVKAGSFSDLSKACQSAESTAASIVLASASIP
jgi:hypothetical protein